MKSLTLTFFISYWYFTSSIALSLKLMVKKSDPTFEHSKDPLTKSSKTNMEDYKNMKQLPLMSFCHPTTFNWELCISEIKVKDFKDVTQRQPVEYMEIPIIKLGKLITWIDITLPHTVREWTHKAKNICLSHSSVKQCYEMNKLLAFLELQGGKSSTQITFNSEPISTQRVDNDRIQISSSYLISLFSMLLLWICLCLLYVMIFKQPIVFLLTEKYFNPLRVECNFNTIQNAVNDKEMQEFLFHSDKAFFKKKYGAKFKYEDFDSITILNDLYNVLNGDVDEMPKSYVAFSIELFARIIELKKAKFKLYIENKVNVLFFIVLIVLFCFSLINLR